MKFQASEGLKISSFRRVEISSQSRRLELLAVSHLLKSLKSAYLVDSENRSIWNFGILLFSNLFFSIKEKKWLEGRWCIHGDHKNSLFIQRCLWFLAIYDCVSRKKYSFFPEHLWFVKLADFWIKTNFASYNDRKTLHP